MSSQNHCEFCLFTTVLGFCEIYSEIVEIARKTPKKQVRYQPTDQWTNQTTDRPTKKQVYEGG